VFTSVEGRAVVVTRGVGKGIASVFARSGALVLITGQTIVVDGGQVLPESPDAMN
jgi:hypothetical protein